MVNLLFFFAGSFFLCLVLVPLVRRFAEKNRIMDIPSLRKTHTEPIPRLGGVAIFLSFMTMCLVALPLNSRLNGFLLGATLIVIIGVLDDILDLDARTKLSGQLMAALVAVAGGCQIHYVTDFSLSQGVAQLGWLSIPLTVFWIVGLTNTMNIIDGLDGLCAGIATIAALTLVTVQLSQNQFMLTEAIRPSVLILLILAGSCLGFLFYNHYPATIFMGDSGSLLLGYSLSVLSILGSLKGATLVTLVIPILALGFPVFDTLFAILRRRWLGKPIFEADREHIHHRLLNAGFSHPRVVLLLWGISAAFGLTALFVSRLPARSALGILFFLSFGLFGLMIIMVLRSRRMTGHES